MYREHEKSIDNIYENYDAKRGKFEREITDCNATRIQSSELTGADGVKIIRFRAVAVCLILLCVLLLTAVIVLCVTFISTNNERNRLIFINENLTRERDELKWEKNDLQMSLGNMDGWTYYQSSLYFFSSEWKSWNESRRYCRDRGADLIVINNGNELEFVNKVVNKEFDVFWIGLSEVEGVWKWVDGSALNSR
ncbi:C-type lectin domain family 4 member F-like [Siphateles boraxobius]|uniref:C-type lectin domain family 4 member F-like n=1 Tax=Siphateles boraxobius TaxID=180520 RepID=UPI0040631FA0